ncbi:MAG TPA: PAS domain-containing protein [bacterium]|nr:PAS domain-containing protein [bacterium]
MSTALGILLMALVVLWWWCGRLRRARDEALARLRQQEAITATQKTDLARLAAGLGGTADGLIVLDAEGHVAACNPAAQALADLPEHDCHGARLEELVPWPRLHEALQACRQTGSVQTFEFEEEGGSARTLVVRVHALPGFGAVVGIDDQSRLKRLESLRRDFVANVSHELKTPLAAIKGFVETVQDDPEMPPATRQRFLERIARQTERLSTLVTDLLTLSRLDDDAGRFAADPCDLGAVVREAVRDLLPLAETREIDLQAHLPEHAPWVRADREGLRQIVGNLIDNALKYTPERGVVTVRLSVRAGRIRLEVADTGIGLSPSDQERIFERFYRVDRARSRELGGTGLGLSIVKNTVRNLGGAVGVDSELGVGSRFWVELPEEPGAAAGAAEGS